MVGEVYKALVENKKDVDSWFSEKSSKLCLPFYSSFDIRNSGYKSVVIDSNVFPQGWNNICSESQPYAGKAMSDYITKEHDGVKNILLVSEDFTKNRYYFENLRVLGDIIGGQGFNVKFGSFSSEITTDLDVSTITNKSITIEKIKNLKNSLNVKGFQPDLIVLNNDFSSTDVNLVSGLKVPVVPFPKLGWYKRKKNEHFRHKNDLVKSVAKELDVDRWAIGAYFDFQDGINFKEKKNFEKVARKIDLVIGKIQKKYHEYKIKDKPFVFVKGNSSTYGMNALPFKSGDEFLKINSDIRNKMGRSKGGKLVSSVMIQEGVATHDEINGQISEPVVYSVGCCPVGGFFRMHSKKDKTQNLNAPGMEFTPGEFCPMHKIGDSRLKKSNITKEKIEIYNFLARIGVLAIGMELKDICKKN